MTDPDQQENSNGNGSQGAPKSGGVPGAPFAQAIGTGREIAQQIENFQRRVQEIGKIVQRGLDRYREFGQRLSRQLSQIDWDHVQKALDELDESVERVQSYLVGRGWYLPIGLFSLGRVHKISRLVKEGEDETIEAFVRNYARKHEMPVVREAVPELFPRREEIVRQALEAHENEQYALTVPLLLSQAEGMFFAALEGHFYDEDEREETRREIKNDPDMAYAILTMDHLFQPGPLHEDYDGNPREVARRRDFSFNRHLILHGHSTDYHTEANSLRAIALVALTCRVVRRLEEK